MKLSLQAPTHWLALLLASSLGAALLAAIATFAVVELLGARHPLMPIGNSKIVATVDGVAVTEDDVGDAMLDIGPGLPQKLEGPAREKYVVDYLIDLKLVAKKAAADKVDVGADFARRLAYYHDKLAMEAVLSSVAKAATTDEAEHKAYDEAAKAQPPAEEVHARHILLPTEEDAKAALARIKAGEGGDLGWFTKDRMVPEFADAAFKLQPGQVSDPVQSQFGWHIIKVEERRMRTFPPFDQVKDQAARYVGQKAQSELIAALRQGVKIERMDEEPKPDATPAGDAKTPDGDAKPKTP